MGGAGYHRSWAAAHVVQTAAGTEAAEDEDESDENKSSNPQDHRNNRIVFI